MVGQTISHYKILEKLGEGGMGVVYKAEDLKLRRIVALKFLPLNLTSTPDKRARFEQEAQAASALNHPNVCHINAIEEHEGQQFIDMEFVDGVTLRQILPVQKVQEALGYAIQIGDALNEAHGKGIVHRDIKCENIMVSSKNQIKVMDFGLAKMKGTMKLTHTSSTVGTLAYMAPEQIQGGIVDARSDIFSFGTVLFEMLTGKTPFRGEHEAAMMYSILNEEPESVAKYRPELSPELDRIIRRSLEKDPQDRYQHVDDMVSELRRLQKQSTKVVRPSPGDMTVPASHDTKPAAPGIFDGAATRRRIFLLGGAVLGIGVLAAVEYLLFVGREIGAEKRIDSIAVLPFTNVGGDPNTEYISDGITENIINNLTTLHKLRVVPRSTSFHYKGKELDPQKIGGELHVSAVLTGRVTQHGENLNIQSELVDVLRQSQLWGKQYQQKLTDILGMQDEISRDIAAQLQLQLSGEEQKNLTKRGTNNVEAYELYLKGRYYWNKRDAENIKRGIQFFSQAIEKDSQYALAYAGLADSYVSPPLLLPPKEVIPKAKAAAVRALEIDNQLAEPHAALAYAKLRFDFDPPGADKEFSRAFELNPNYSIAHQWHGFYFMTLGRFEEAFAEERQALKLDPLSLVINASSGWVFYYARHYDEAMQQCRKTLELDPNFHIALWILGKCYEQRGMYQEAVAAFQKVIASSGNTDVIAALGHTYATMGRRDEAEKVIRQLKELSKNNYIGRYSLGEIYIALNKKEEAFEQLQEALSDHDFQLIHVKVDPWLDSLRSDHRFVELLKKTGVEQ
ncbi:MAG: tetratricopeptide repeat protein [Ignavibacteria bacterium]|nr:MAG: tetratricopeptide repeat protein [Ignavibacteria bacterium]